MSRRTGEPLRNALLEAAARPEQACQHAGEADDGEREDERHYAAAGYPYGDHRRLTAVHLAALYLLCILDGYPALRQIDRNYSGKLEKSEHEEPYQFPQRREALCAAEENAELLNYRDAGSGDYAYEDDKRYAVAYAVFGDPFADEHNEHCAGGVYHHKEYAAYPRSRGVGQKSAFAAAEHYKFKCVFFAVYGYVDYDAYCLRNGEKYCHITRYLRYLFAALLTLAREALERGNADGQKLNYNGCIDIRADTQRKQSCIGKRRARYRRHQFEKVVICYCAAEYV